MTGSVRNGRRAAASFGAWKGAAGVQDREGGLIEVAFRANFREVREVSEGRVDGKRVEVLSAARSEFVAGMVVLACREMPKG